MREKQRKLLLGFAVISLLLLAAVGTLAINVRLAQGQLETLSAYRQLVESQLQGLVVYEEPYAQLSELYRVKEEIMAGQVDWPELLVELGQQTPEGVWLTDFRGQVGKTGENGSPGQLVLRGKALDHLLVSRYLEKLRSMPFLAEVQCRFSLGANESEAQFEIQAAVSTVPRDAF
ncbi:MAG TPA: PilN domain-containing protein [Clostridia bacterium]|nr:PilN domain-containing protein [Clostridia bacterium]